MSFDTIEDNRAFAEKFSLPYGLLCDRDRTMGIAYGAATEPGQGGYARRIGVVIDPDGVLLHVEPSVDPASFAADALAMIRAHIDGGV